jgi:PAS domain S-box-containing protein
MDREPEPDAAERRRPVQEYAAIAIWSNETPSSQHPPASLAERASLTYQAMSNSDDIILVLERDRLGPTNEAIIIAVNEAFCRASGYTDDQLVGGAVAGLFTTADHAAILTKAIHGNGSLRTELSCNRASGGGFMLGMHLMPAPARTAGRDCFVILGRDITAALQARQMQDSIQRLLAKVFSSVDAPVAIVNGAGRIVMTNPRIDQLLGYKPNGLLGRTSIEIVAPQARERVTALIGQQTVDGHDTVQNAPLLRADGSEILVKITSVVAMPEETKQFRILTVRPQIAASSETRSESVGRLKLVGIEEVRAALGARWSSVAARAMATAEVVIKRNCGPQDSYSRADDTSFLMCFGSLSEEEASFRAAMIGREIRNRLIGDGQDPEEAYVRSVAAMVRFDDEGQSAESLQILLMDRLNKQIERIEEAARQTLRDALICATCDLTPVVGRSTGQLVATEVCIPGKLEQRVTAAMAALPRNECKEFDRDGLLLGLAAQQAVTTLAQGDTMPLLVSLSFDIFAARAATERFFAVCARMDPRVAGRLILVLGGLPPGLPRTRLQDCVSRLRPFCRAVGYEIEDLATLPQINLSNSYHPVLVLPAALCKATAPDTLRNLIASLQSHRAKVMVRGAASDHDAAAFRTVGADMVSMKSAAALSRR